MRNTRNIAILCHPSAGGSGVVATELGIALAELGNNIHFVSTERPFRLTDERLQSIQVRTNVKLDSVKVSETQKPIGIFQSFFDQSRKSVLSWLGKLPKAKEVSRGSIYFHQIQGSDYPLFNEPMTTLVAANALAQVIEDYGIEIVHAHYAIPHATTAIMARDMGLPIKVVTTLHGTDVTLLGQDPAFVRTTRHAVLNSDAVTAVSHSLAEDTRKNLGIDRKISVVYNWVDAERFSPIEDAAYRLKYAQPDEAILVHVSNFRPVKRPVDVVKAFAKIAHEIPARLLMVGMGPLRQECIELAAELELTGRIHFVDFTTKVEKLMAVGDLFFLPSENESFGLAALEAMSCGVPVIASRTGGLPELIRDGIDGVLVPVGDIDAMAAAALSILADPVRRKEMSKAARQSALQQFRPEAILPAYLEVYDSVMDAGLPPKAEANPQLSAA